MDASMYWKYQVISAGAMGFLMGLGAHQENKILIVFALVIGVSSMVYFRRKVEGPLYDERSSIISTKASAATFSAFTLLSLALSAILYYLGITSNTEYLRWAYGLAYIVCAIMILRLFFWAYYTRKYGG